MKKIVCMLLLIQSGFLMAQTEETFVTVNGKKVKINPNSLNTADNGLTAENGKVQLGGALLKPTTIVTNSENTLTIDGLQVGADTDNILVADANGVLKWVTRASLGDNLGNHIATQSLNMGNFPIITNNPQNKDFSLMIQTTSQFGDNVHVYGGGLRIDNMPVKQILSEEDANQLKLVTLEAASGEPLKITSFKNAMEWVKDDFIKSIPPVEGDNLGDHKAKKPLDMGNHPINGGGEDRWGLIFRKGTNNFDAESKDYSDSNEIGFERAYVVIDHLPNLKPNDPSEIKPNSFDFVTRNLDGGILRSTSLNEVMDAAQNQYFMPKISLENNDVEDAKANLLLKPQEGQLVYNTNPNMKNGKGIGIYYNQDDYWVPVANPTPGDNLGNHIATQSLNMGNFPIITNNPQNKDFSLMIQTTSQFGDNVHVYGGGLRIDNMPVKQILSEEDANQLKLVTLEAASGEPLKITSFKNAMEWVKDDFIKSIPPVEGDNLGDHKAKKPLDMGNHPINDGGGNWGLKFVQGEGDFNPDAKDFSNSNRARFEKSFVVIDNLPVLKPNDPSEIIPNGFDFVTRNQDGNILRSTPLNDVISLAKDNLGDHIAMQDLEMSHKNINGALNITAAGTVTGDKLTADTKIIAPGAQITFGAGEGKIAVSDALGNLTWTNASLEGLLVNTKTVSIAGFTETPYSVNTSTTLKDSKQSVRIDKLSRVILSGSVVIGAKPNTMGCGYIVVKQNGAQISGFGSNVKYSILNPVLSSSIEIDPDTSLTTTVSYETVIDDLQPGTYEFSVDINPTWSAPVTTGTSYTPEHYCPGKSYLTYKVYNK